MDSLVNRMVAALMLQALLLQNGADTDRPEPGLLGYESKNIFRRADGSQYRVH